MTLKPIEAVREEELSSVAAPWCAISWLKSAHSGYCRIQGFNDLWEACILEQDSHHDHWNHRTHGFERLCAKINQGDWVVVLDRGWPPLAPAYAQVNGHWQPTRHIGEPRLRQRLGSQVQTIQRAQREQEALQSRNQPSSAQVQTEPASGPGNRAASLGTHVENTKIDAAKKHPAQTSNTFKSQDAAAKAALGKANPLSIQDNLEYGGLVYRDKTTGEYGYTGPIKGSDQGVNPFSAPVPSGCELVGDFHTHADYSVVDRNTGAAIRTSDPRRDDFNSDNFSSADVKGIKGVGSSIPGYKGYLGTPSGTFKVYDPSTGVTGTP